MSTNPFDRNKTKEATLGKLITEPGEQNQRDAVHIAVVPVIAHHRMNPGSRVGVHIDIGTRVLADAAAKPHVGIVDPFLEDAIEPGQTFWLFLFQGSVTTLRHEWTHPAFPAVAQQVSESASLVGARAVAKAAIREIAANTGITYDDLMAAADQYVRDGDYTIQHDSQSWQDRFYGQEERFWANYQIVTGKTVDNTGAHFFSCSC